MALSGAEAANDGRLKTWWVVLGIVMSVVGAAVPGYEQIRKERQRKEAERAAIDAAVEMRVTINDALDPIVRQLGRIATATSRQERGNLREATIPMILDSAAHLIKGRRVRACWFRIEEGQPRRLEPAQYAGRADAPVTVFEEGTAEGDSVFAMIRDNEHLQSSGRRPPSAGGLARLGRARLPVLRRRSGGRRAHRVRHAHGRRDERRWRQPFGGAVRTAPGGSARGRPGHGATEEGFRRLVR